MFGPCGAQGGVSRADLEVRLDTALAVGRGDGGAALGQALVVLHEVMAALESVRVELVAAFDRSGEAGMAGYRSPTAWLVAHTGMAAKAAGSVRRVCRAAAERPVLSVAAGEGRLSHDHLRALVDARRDPVIEVWDRDEAELVAAACRLTVDGLRLHLAAWYHEALVEVGRNEPDGPEPKGSDGNRFRMCPGIGGRGLFDGELTPAARAAVMARLDAGYEALRRAGALEHDPRTVEEIYGDLFVALFEQRADGSTIAPRVSAVIDLDTLLARAGAAEPADRMRRRAEIVGVGPVSDDAIAELCEQARVSLVVTDRGHALWFGRGRRLASAAQRAAAIAVSGGVCSFPGCTLAADRCQIDHLLGWEDDGTTDQPNLAPLCQFHNRLKHRRRIRAVRRADGTIEWTAPGGTPITARWLHLLTPGWTPHAPRGAARDGPGP